MVLLGIVLFLVLQSGGAQKDPLHTDLTASPVYAKMGFRPSYAHITDPQTLKWDLTLPPHSGPIIMSDLPEPQNYTRYSEFSIANRDIEEFTILIPFTLKESALRTTDVTGLLYPVLHLASIGENWEIFVNGHSVAQQIFLDGSGRITRFRNIRDLQIPVAKEYLHEGENSLVIRILGAYSSKWTGLRYASPYYLGNSSFTASNYTGISNMVLCAIFMFTGLYHLLTYAFRKTDRYNLLFVGFTVIASLYFFAETQIIFSIVPNTAFNQRLDYGLMYLLVFLGVAFLESINTGKLTKATVVYGAFSALLAVGQWFFPVWFSYGLVSVWRYTTIVYAAYAVVFDVLWQIYQSAAKLKKSAGPDAGFWRALSRYLFKTEFGSIYIMLMIVGLTVIIDLINIAVFNLNFPLKDYSLLGFTVGMAYILARKYSSGYEDALRESIASGQQNLESAGLTAGEMDVALLLIEGSTRHEIARKLHLSASEVSQDISAIREKVIRKSDSDSVVAFAAVRYGLTRRETDTLRCLRSGMTNKQIAVELVLSEETVKSHVRSLMKKLPVESRQDIVSWTDPEATKDT